MKHNTPKKVVVAVAVHGSIEQERLAGIFRYLSENNRWNLDIVRDAREFTSEALQKLVNEGLNGIIAGISSAHETLAWLGQIRTPTVILNPSAAVEQGDPDFQRRANAGVVYVDSVAIGQAAANEFLSQGGFKCFAFLGYPIDYGWSTRRGQAFAATLRRHGFQTAMFDRAHFGNRTAERQSLIRWLQQLTKPCGLLAVGDGPGCMVIDICNELDIRVPEDIAVIGVNNDTLLCDNITPGLTSVHPDFERNGYEAARMLDELMNGKRPISNTIAIGVREIVRRDSSRPISTGGRLVEKALAYIESNATRHLHVEDVAAHLHVSRRLAELRFRELLGESVGNTITKYRINEVKRRLIADSRETIERVSLLCGFDNPISLKNTFRRLTGMSMREYRNRHTKNRSPPPPKKNTAVQISFSRRVRGGRRGL